jgi:uncharacterized membrane protein YfcA
MIDVWPFVVVATVGVLVGTLLGTRVHSRVPELLFRRVVSAIILILGAVMLVGVGRQFLT